MLYRHRMDWRAAHRILCRFPFSMVLAGASLFYGMGVRARLQLYSRGVIKQKRLPGFVLSVGNITVGGTGKTPTVVMLAKWARSQGYSVCILSRGYGGRYKGDVLEVSDGKTVRASWTESGDEPYMIARKLSGVPVVVCKKRFIGGLYAQERFGSDFFILDDGFQHLGLCRDFDLVLVESHDPLELQRLFPWGWLREPTGALARAHCVLLTKWRQGTGALRNQDFLKRRFSKIKIFKAVHLPEKIELPHANTCLDPTELQGVRIVGFAGIARPQAFAETLQGLGADVVHLEGFEDHHIFVREELEALVAKAKQLRAELLLTTEKDWVRLETLGLKWARMGYLAVHLSLVGNNEEFFQLIRHSVEQIVSGRGHEN